jgi:large subunit ribosomal protein L19
MLRQLAFKARGALAAATPAALAELAGRPAAADAARPLSALLSLRAFRGAPTPADDAAGASVASDSVAATKPPAQAPHAPLPPWTPTAELAKRKALPKRMAHLISLLDAERSAAAEAERPRPDFRPGDFLELKLAVPENKRRATTFRGIVIARRNRGWRSSFTLRNFVGAQGGVERSFPLHSPHLLDVKVLEPPGGKRRRARRAKLYYLRDRPPKEYRI